MSLIERLAPFLVSLFIAACGDEVHTTENHYYGADASESAGAAGTDAEHAPPAPRDATRDSDNDGRRPIADSNWPPPQDARVDDVGRAADADRDPDLGTADPDATHGPPVGAPAGPCGAGDIACDDGQQCGDDGLCPIACPRAGTFGCPCADGATCETGPDGRLLRCSLGGSCIQVPPGQSGGPCLPGDECDAALVCAVDLGTGLPSCVHPVDPVVDDGELGGRCLPDNACVGVGAGGAVGCERGRCVVAQCNLGAEGCLCGRGFRCDPGMYCAVSDDHCRALPPDPLDGGGTRCQEDADCSVGFVCDPAGTCIEDCIPGQPDCRCLGGACESPPGRLFDCTIRGCEELCVPGSLLCACTGGHTCDSGMTCIGGRCLADEGPPGPEPAQPAVEPPLDACFSPCSADVDSGGNTFRCDSDHLITGCVPRTANGATLDPECNAGHCLLPDEEPTLCSTDADCPDYQTCHPASNMCQSTCLLDDDCLEGRRCDKHVCRQTCSTTGLDRCPRGTFCAVVDGENGTCRPLVEPNADSELAPNGSFAVTPTHVAVSNTRTQATIRLRNESPRPRSFRVFRHAQADAVENAGAGPLFWLRLAVAPEGIAPGPGGFSPIPTTGIEIDLPSGGASDIVIDTAGLDDTAWTGALRVDADEIGSREIAITYAASPEGQWAGTMYYFSSFNEDDLREWIPGQAVPAGVKNAFIQKWGDRLRTGRMAIDEFDALLSATTEGTWAQPATETACHEAYGVQGGTCYPYVAADPLRACPTYRPIEGLCEYTNDPSAEIPRGVVRMPFAINIRPRANDPRRYDGRIDSFRTLHYPGNPAVALTLSTDPNAAPGQISCDPAIRAGGRGPCAVPILHFASTAVVGGRRRPNPDGNCNGDLEMRGVPWLVTGFLGGATPADPADPTSAFISTECLEIAFPYVSDNAAELNPDLAAANPIQDGRPRVRRIHMVDGLIVDSDRMLVLFKEEYEDFFSNTPGADSNLTAYGVLDLSRSQADIRDADFVAGTTVTDAAGGLLAGIAQAEDRPSALGAACTADVLRRLRLDDRTPVDRAGWLARLNGLVSGTPVPPDQLDYYANGTAGQDRIHYVCHATGRFNDCGPSPAIRDQHCPPGSGRTFFSVPQDGPDDAALCSDPCNASSTCLSHVIESPSDTQFGSATTPWGRRNHVTVNLPYRCAEQLQIVSEAEQFDKVLCDANRANLRDNKLFLPATALDESPPVLAPIAQATADAFRYRTRFQNRDGVNLGFTPRICQMNSEAIQYCYDPNAIEAIGDRTECLLAMASTGSAMNLLTDPDEQILFSALEQAFTGRTGFDLQTGEARIIERGSESLRAELLIMLGDDAYTAAFAARFDLAGIRGAAFDGERFEIGGSSFAGPAGYEMRSLYLSTQYYRMVVDRFLRHSPQLWSGRGEGARQYFGIGAVTQYLAKIVRASAQKARAFSAIAERYQTFNQPDVARRVIQREYVATYLESMAIGRFVNELLATADTDVRAQMRREAEVSQGQYDAALLAMVDVYKRIEDDILYFGFAPEYVPFPALDPEDTNAFEKLLQAARLAVADAAEKEQRALDESKAYETDRASFENELTKIRNNYENQLAVICGTMQSAADGRVLPAIPKYAALNVRARELGNPCGLMGSGSIHQAIGAAEKREIELQRRLAAGTRLVEEVNIIQDRSVSRCAELRDQLVMKFDLDEVGARINDEIEFAKQAFEDGKALYAEAKEAVQGLICITGTATDCPAKIGARAAIEKAAAVFKKGKDLVQGKIAAAKQKVEKWRSMKLELEGDVQCQDVASEAKFEVKRTLVHTAEAELDAVVADYDLRLALSEALALRNQATRLIAQQEEAEELQINIEAARNDPNTRIYKNDAILNADRTFDGALKAAYRVTRVFEYYTSQSYAHLNDLFLVRMVARGDVNLEAYLDRLADSFEQFEDAYGNPDVRLAIISLRDDALRIPRTDPETGAALSHGQRVRDFREQLTDLSRLNEHGYVEVTFGTAPSDVSPRTRNHKVLYLEAEIQTTDPGDGLARIYLTQKGQGGLLPLPEGALVYRRFTPRTAVLDPFFNGRREFPDQDVYRNERLRDRPFISTHWEVQLNQVDEAVNRDLDLATVDDIRFYVYYTDFTEL